MLNHMSCPNLPPVNNPITFKADSGASKHYLKINDMHVLTHMTDVAKSRQVTLPNNEKIEITKEGILPLNLKISAEGRKASVLPGLQNTSLLSLGQLCDDDCTIALSKSDMKVYKNNNLILKGIRNITDGLWDVQITPRKLPPMTEEVNVMIRLDGAKMDLANYLHASLFSPMPSTLHKAIKNKHLITWPGIDNINFTKFVNDNIPMRLGHLNQERKGLRSTKSAKDSTEDFNPPQDTKHNEVMSLVFEFNGKEMAYGDITGAFPYTSTRGNKYIYVMYDYDGNAILVKAIPNRQAATIKNAWENLYCKLTKQGHVIKNFILDNEISDDLKSSFKKYNISFQCVPPHIHRVNAAERAIQTFKHHFLSGLATCNSKFPIDEWDRLLPQAQMTLNMLRATRINPKLSSYTYLHGNFDFNATPIAPPGTKVIIHKKVDDRLSWEYHGKMAWYIGPAMSHYRCVKCYVPSTNTEIIADTVQFIPEHVPIPIATTESFLRQAVADIVTLLKTENKLNLPMSQYGDNTRNAVDKIASLLNRSVRHHQAALVDNQQKHTVPKPRVKDSVPQPRVVSNDTHKNWDSIASKIKQMKTSLQALPPKTAPIAIPTPKSQSSFNVNEMLYKHIFPHGTSLNEVIYHIFSDDGKRQNIDQLLKGPMKIIWGNGLDNELGRLADGVPGVLGTKTISFIFKSEIPRDKKITYANMVCDEKPLKQEKYRVRLTIGGDKLDYFFETASPTTSLTETKILVNSVISDAHKGARFMTIDIKDFFLNTILQDPEYMKIHSKYFSKKFRDLYKLHNKIDADGYVYCAIKKGMYGLKQAAILAYQQLARNLKKHGYHPLEGATGLWGHRTLRTKFALCVDDFGVKYFNMSDAMHLINALENYYTISKDWKGEDYCGVRLNWNYDKGYVDINMPNYIKKALLKFQHKPPTRPQHAPMRWTKPDYGKKRQYVEAIPKSTLLDKKETRVIQSKCGTFLYYGRAVDPIILVALNEIAGDQSKPTKRTSEQLAWLMDYLVTYPNATLRFHAGTMQLKVESDASYLSVKGAKSRIGGHFYLDAHYDVVKSTNSPILTECSTIRNVVCSAAEAECGALFHNCQKAIVLRRTLESLNHPQKATEVVTDNKTANSFVTNTMKMKKSKTWDMRWNWLREKNQKKNFRTKWEQGKNNKADPFTKLHSPAHLKEKRGDYILKGFSVSEIVKNVLKKRKL